MASVSRETTRRSEAPLPILIVPGFGNSGPDHWQSLWQSALPGCVRVEQRDWEAPIRAEWVETLDDAIGRQPAAPVLVAHSLGCLAVAHWATAHARPVKGALLVAPPDVEEPYTPEAVRGFAPIPMARLPFATILVASRNDVYTAFARARGFADAWGSRFVDCGDAGHINADAGFGSWPDGERLLAELRAD